ncbi:Os04g0521001 [Oryza sativa Japonica Group]|uniref:Os04g0521001 protein n=1 Tax=Oryza sativa subsp. japonica TaxID=39947 RepID=A0A0P0WCX2_ORYSJ|nr:Os04g0521001 [Oryza sativa Japonica Group]
MPCLVLVVDHRSSQAPCRVDAGAGDRDRGQVNHEHREPNWKRSKHRDVGVAGVALGVGGGEDGVDEHEGADDLGGEAGALGVAVAELVGAAAIAHVEGALEPLDEPDAADGAEALRYDVEHRAHQRHLARQEEPERHRRVDVAAGHAGGAVDEDEDHAAERPRDAEDADAAARGVGGVRARVRLVLVPDDRGHRDVEEEQRGHELGDHRAVQGPLGQLLRVDQRRRRRVGVVLRHVLPALRRRRRLNVLRHLRSL